MVLSKCKSCGTVFRGDYGEAVDTVALRRAMSVLEIIENHSTDWSLGTDENMEAMRILARDALQIVRDMRKAVI